MKTIQNADNITIKVSKDELIEGKWLHAQLLSKKLHEIEEDKNTSYKQLRIKMYNSLACEKYNVKEIAGLKCIDVDNPMKTSASLVLNFERV